MMRTVHHTPPILIVPAVIGLAVLVLPLAALVGRVDLASLGSDLLSPTVQQALVLSVATALVATSICVALGVPLALLIARSGPRLSAALRIAATIPLVLPPMVGGVALLYLFGRRGALGALLWETWGLQLPFTTAAVVVAQTFVALPFLVLTLEGALRTSGVGHETTASTLGAGRWFILWRVTMPLAAPGLISGVTLSFARAMGEFGATALFAGNAPGITQTMPLAIYAAFNGIGADQDDAVVLSLLLLVSTLAMLVLVRSWRPPVVR